ncbi:MAG: TetR/AcrR family transcriptional regulator [Gammaproteobacteria bacterium]|nr:TetR/AcrR family transcriptional regulator [Gammaproteobacteria bacterium]
MTEQADPVTDFVSQVGDEELVRQRRAQIVAAAVQLFSEQGYYRTKVQDVAKRAGVSAGLIYQYVRDKEDLLLLSILDVLDSYTAEIPRAVGHISDPLARCVAAFRTYCRVVDQRRDATILAYRSTKSLAPARRQIIKRAERQTNQLIAGYIQTCIDLGLFRAVDTELATYQLVMYAHAWALKYWQFAKRFDLETYIEHGLDLFLHALLTERGRALLDRTTAAATARTAAS